MSVYIQQDFFPSPAALKTLAFKLFSCKNKYGKIQAYGWLCYPKDVAVFK